MSNSQCYVWDVTIPCDKHDHTEVQEHLIAIAKAWAFQEEMGAENGYHHFQVRYSLKEKLRERAAVHQWVDAGFEIRNLARTSSNCALGAGRFTYVMKDDTRIAGPWTDKDPYVFIPERFQVEHLYPWQQSMLDTVHVEQPRVVNVIYDPEGCSGKSTIGSIIELQHGGLLVPPVDDAKDLMQFCMSIMEARRSNLLSCVIIDLPRAMNQKKLHGLFAAIEDIKNGRLWDMRHKARILWLKKSPTVWVCTNTLPDLEYLSRDRWNIFSINSESGEFAQIHF